MTKQRETVLLAWARDADGECQMFTGEDIYNRAGHWSMDRMRRDIPVIVAYYCRMGRLHFTVAIDVVPEQAVPHGVPLKRPDETFTLDSLVLLAYKRPEED